MYDICFFLLQQSSQLNDIHPFRTAPVSQRFDQIHYLFAKSYISGLDYFFNILGLEGVGRQGIGRYACQCVEDSEA